MKPLPKGKEELTDELSTQPGLEVTVRPDGSIKIKKKPDPNWYDMVSNEDPKLKAKARADGTPKKSDR